MTLIVKICGLCDHAGLGAALSAGADMVGFVFHEASPRHVGFALARVLGARVEQRARKVALTVDADDATIAAIIGSVEPDILQLHGAESPERVSAIRARFGVPVMKALAVSDRADLDRIALFDAVADHLLFDARPPAGATRPGGHGATFDWALLRGVETQRDWLLAGGLTTANVAQAIAMTGASGLDVSSGVESAPGRKDPVAIARFVAGARDGHARWALARADEAGSNKIRANKTGLERGKQSVR